MLICRLKNGAIVTLKDVHNVKLHIDNLLNELLESNSLDFPRRLPLNELSNKVKSDQYIITNAKVKNILISHGFLDNQGFVPENVKNILESAIEERFDMSGFNNPVVEILGDLTQACL